MSAATSSNTPAATSSNTDEPSIDFKIKTAEVNDQKLSAKMSEPTSDIEDGNSKMKNSQHIGRKETKH